MSRRPVIQRARKLRQDGNAPEDVAWQVLRKLRGFGYPVRRQHPIGPYIADFAIQKAMLVIEIDGGVHASEGVGLRDAEREVYLRSLGWRVVRIDAQTAMSADHVMSIVSEALGI